MHFDLYLVIFFSQAAIDTYFIQIGYGRYQFRPEFNTEKKLNAYFESITKTTQEIFISHFVQVLKKQLSSLMKNVVLLRDPHNEYHFYPRINMEKTSSFQSLDWYLQEKLRDLYLDYFYKRQEGLWHEIGMNRLPVIKESSKMLVCGEDLGMIPACVPPVLRDLSIMGLCVQRMPPDPKKLFQHPSDYPYMTVCTPSSHDCSTIRGWWEEDRDKTNAFWKFQLGMSGDAPLFAEDWICRKVIEQHMHSKSILCIFPVQEIFFYVFRPSSSITTIRTN